MIKSTEIMEHLENEINKMCNAGDGWENWYPKYYNCDDVNFVQDVFSWLEYADGEVVECHDMCSWEKTALEYNNDTEKALKDVHRIVKRIYDECYLAKRFDVDIAFLEIADADFTGISMIHEGTVMRNFEEDSEEESMAWANQKVTQKLSQYDIDLLKGLFDIKYEHKD